MGIVATITKQCDRCKTLYGGEQMDVEKLMDHDAVKKEYANAADPDPGFQPENVPWFCLQIEGEILHTYMDLCDGCKRVLSRMAKEAGPVTRKPRGPSTKKTNGDGKEAAPAEKPAEKKSTTKKTGARKPKGANA
jgi:hypothetical protein